MYRCFICVCLCVVVVYLSFFFFWGGGVGGNGGKVVDKAKGCPNATKSGSGGPIMV